jgi:hypothetical protein
VTGTTRLPGLPGVARQSLCRLPGEGNHCQRYYEGPNPKSEKDLRSATSPGSHGVSPKSLANRTSTGSSKQFVSSREDFEVALSSLLVPKRFNPGLGGREPGAIILLKRSADAGYFRVTEDHSRSCRERCRDF